MLSHCFRCPSSNSMTKHEHSLFYACKMGGWKTLGCHPTCHICTIYMYTNLRDEYCKISRVYMLILWRTHLTFVYRSRGYNVCQHTVSTFMYYHVPLKHGSCDEHIRVILHVTNDIVQHWQIYGSCKSISDFCRGLSRGWCVITMRPLFKQQQHGKACTFFPVCI